MPSMDSTSHDDATIAPLGAGMLLQAQVVPASERVSVIPPMVPTPVVIGAGGLEVQHILTKPDATETPPTLPPVHADDGSGDAAVPPVVVNPAPVIDAVVDPVMSFDPLPLPTAPSGGGGPIGDGPIQIAPRPLPRPIFTDTPPTLPPVLNDPSLGGAPGAPDMQTLDPGLSLADLVGPIDLDALRSPWWPHPSTPIDASTDPALFPTGALEMSAHCGGASSLAHCQRLVELMALGDGGGMDYAPQPISLDPRVQVFTP